MKKYILALAIIAALIAGYAGNKGEHIADPPPGGFILEPTENNV
jgi:hypothetical protein